MEAEDASLDMSSGQGHDDQTEQTTEEPNPFETARRLLQLSEVPEFLPGRTQEGEVIEKFLINSLTKPASHPILYISGVPGTGKTASALGAIRRIQKQVDEKQLPDFEFVNINGMDLAETKKAFSVLWFFLTQDKESAALSEKYLKERFSTRSATKCVLLLDEMDKLINEKKQGVLYQIFDWATSKARRLVVIGIANTMNLEERLIMRVRSRLGSLRLGFSAYSRPQLTEIITERLRHIDAFEKSAIEYASAAIAVFSGDARRALRICRRAADLAELDMYKQELQKGSTPEGGKDKVYRVTIEHVKQALDEFKSSPAINSTQMASKFEKIFLCALLRDRKITGSETATFEGVSHRFYTVCTELAIKRVPTVTVLYAICEQLSACGLLAHNPRKDLEKKIKLNCDTEEIYYALREDSVVGPLLPENVC